MNKAPSGVIKQVIKNGYIAQRTVKRSRKIDAETATAVVTSAFLNQPIYPHMDHKAAIVRFVSQILKNTGYDYSELNTALTVFFRQENNDRKHSIRHS